MMTTDIQPALARLREAIMAERPHFSAALFSTPERRATDAALAELERLLAAAPVPDEAPLFKVGDEVRLKPGVKHDYLHPGLVVTVRSETVDEGVILVDDMGVAVMVPQRDLELATDKRDEVLTLGRLESLLLRAELAGGSPAAALRDAVQKELQ